MKTENRHHIPVVGLIIGRCRVFSAFALMNNNFGFELVFFFYLLEIKVFFNRSSLNKDWLELFY